MEHFTPLSALLGGAMIGLSASALLAFNGRVAGISGIVGGLLRAAAGDRAWRAAFVAGLLAGGAALRCIDATTLALPGLPAPRVVLLAGLLVGFGTQLGNGCTSGHGVCGISRGARRSVAATAVFMLTGMLTVWMVGALGGAE